MATTRARKTDNRFMFAPICWAVEECVGPSLTGVAQDSLKCGFASPIRACGLLSGDGSHPPSSAVLTIAEREQILRALDDPPGGLAGLRGVLLDEHEGRVRQGLV